MADIELVIKIDEKYWKDIKNIVENDECGENYSPWLEIANGTPLPKGHGIEELRSRLNEVEEDNERLIEEIGNLNEQIFDLIRDE